MVMTARFDGMPEGTLQATLTGTRLSKAFTMKAIFTNAGNDCSKGFYRQYVRGYFQSNNSKVPHVLCRASNVMLKEDVFQEDGCPADGTAYGYRAGPYTGSKYEPNNATGCTFIGNDAPGISGRAGDRLKIHLEFKAELIDTTTAPPTVLATTTWKVEGEQVVPQMMEANGRAEAHATMADGEKLYCKVRRGEGDESHLWTATLVVAHAGANPEREGSSGAEEETIPISLTAWDRDGAAAGRELAVQLLGDPVTVGGPRMRTTTLNFVISDAEQPAHLTGQFNGKPFALQLRPAD